MPLAGGTCRHAVLSKDAIAGGTKGRVTYCSSNLLIRRRSRGRSRQFRTR